MIIDNCAVVQGKRVLIVYGGFIGRGGGVVTHIRNLKRLLESMGARVDTFTMDNLPKALSYGLVAIERLLNSIAAPLGYLVRYRLTRFIFERSLPRGYDYYIYEDIYFVSRRHRDHPHLVFVHSLRSFQLHGLKIRSNFLLELQEWENELVRELRSHIVTVSEEFCERLQTKTGVRPNVLHNFTLLDPSSISWEERKPQVLFVGALIARKNPLFAIRVAHALKQKGMSFTLTFIGDGPLRKSAESLVSRLRLANCVTFLGNTSHEQVLTMMKLSKAVLIPSFEETFSYVALEAKALGCAVFVTEGIDVPPELVDQALPIDRGSEQVWALEIGKVLEAKEASHIKELPEKFTARAAAETICTLLATLGTTP